MQKSTEIFIKWPKYRSLSGNLVKISNAGVNFQRMRSQNTAKVLCRLAKFTELS